MPLLCLAISTPVFTATCFTSPQDWLLSPTGLLEQMLQMASRNNPAEHRSNGTCIEVGDCAFCLAPGTSKETINKILGRLHADFDLNYEGAMRWSTTANGGTGGTGNPIRLTYSFVPDGTLIPANSGEPTSNSVLYQSFNSKFGSTAAWKAKFAECFQRWSQLTGITYTEVSDDGATFPTSAGQLGKRGDIRISAHPIDGQWGILAYAYYPNAGDMVFDSDESWASDSDSWPLFRNTCMHEHGHGIGLGHVFPMNQTKLMEPMLSMGFLGPQDDDIRGGERYYGDALENNDTAGTAIDLGALTSSAVQRTNLSTDSSVDVDWFKFTVPAASFLNVTITPIGDSYSVGASDESAVPINTLAVNNLQAQVYASNGTTLLTTINTMPAGSEEVLSLYGLGASSGLFYVKISNAGVVTNDVQRYTAVFSVTPNQPPVINSVIGTPTLAAAGDQVQITVNASDTTGTLSTVKANGVTLSNIGGATWQGNITAASELGSHTVSVVATDSLGSFSSNNSTSYKTARVVGALNKQTVDPIMANAAQNYLFRVWGKVISVDTTGFTLDDGTGRPVRVNAPGHTLVVNNYATAYGTLDPLARPPAIGSSADKVGKF